MAERAKKAIIKSFNNIGLRITIQTNLKTVTFLRCNTEPLQWEVLPLLQAKRQAFIHQQAVESPFIDPKASTRCHQQTPNRQIARC